jgi:hypothetical protein
MKPLPQLEPEKDISVKVRMVAIINSGGVSKTSPVLHG